jgi:hypothetical protein
MIGDRMSERDSLRVLRVLTAYLLIGCFLTGNVISACASSETSTDSGYSYRDDSNPVAESDHPYANNYENTWTISEPGADQIRLHFKYLKLGVPEKYSFDVYDKLILYDKYDNVLKTYGMAGGAGISKGVNLQDFYTEWYTGDTIKVKLVTDSSGTANGFVIDKTEIRMKETNGPDDSDDAKDVNPENKHEGKTSDDTETDESLDDSNPVAESDHPYANNYENTWTISEPGADQIRLHFKYLKLGVPEKYSFDVYDKLILYDKYDNVLKTYGMAGGAGISKGVNLQDFYTEWYTGDTIKVKLVTDSSGTANGFVIDKTEIRMKETNGPDDSDDAKDVNPENKNKHEEKTSASVQLHGEKTDVTLGEDILLRLSAVNLITNPTMSVQIILIPPSGMSVTSSEFVQSGAGQYTTTYELEPGQGKDIEIRIKSNQVGNFNVNGRVIYYFDGDPEDAEDYTLNLPIKVKEGSSSSSQLPSIDKKNDVQSQNQTKSPGFGSFITLLGLLTFYTLKKRIL